MRGSVLAVKDILHFKLEEPVTIEHYVVSAAQLLSLDFNLGFSPMANDVSESHETIDNQHTKNKLCD